MTDNIIDFAQYRPQRSKHVFRLETALPHIRNIPGPVGVWGSRVVEDFLKVEGKMYDTARGWAETVLLHEMENPQKIVGVGFELSFRYAMKAIAEQQGLTLPTVGQDSEHLIFSRTRMPASELRAYTRWQPKISRDDAVQKLHEFVNVEEGEETLFPCLGWMADRLVKVASRSDMLNLYLGESIGPDYLLFHLVDITPSRREPLDLIINRGAMRDDFRLIRWASDEQRKINGGPDGSR